MRLCQICAYILCSLLRATCTLATNMTAVKVYDVDTCTGAPLQITFTPTDDCSNVSKSPGCSVEAKDIGILASGSCTDDPRAFAAETFKEATFVLVELYASDTNCAILEGTTAYRVDSDCHPTIDTSISFRVDTKDVTPSFNLYNDSSCNSMPLFQYNFSVGSDACVSGSAKLYGNGR